MIKITVKEGENIDRALKRYKRKFKNIKVLQELRERKQFTKKSVKKRKQLKKAQYKEQFLRDKEL
ncbi:MAG: 30S ribosomal protein S21 [Flavobacteriaceae bacterium]|nr:30S ribosomal protein S21 [Flavobacteriaceae bacterium]